MIKNRFAVSPAVKNYIVKICVAVSILLGHIIAGVVLFILQDSVTCRNSEKLLLAELAGVQRSISVADSTHEPEFMYLFTEYDVVGENGGVIISDNLHDIRCGKRVESCRTLEDAGIDINKYKPMKLSEASVFGVDCHVVYFRGDDSVIVAYMPVLEQKQQRNVNVFSALGTTLIFSVLFFFLVPFVLRLFTKDTAAYVGADSVSENLSVSQDFAADVPFSRDTADVSVPSDDADAADSDIVLPEEEKLSADETAETAEAESAGTEIADMEPVGTEAAETENSDAQKSEVQESDVVQKNDTITDFADYVSKMQELKRAAQQLSDEKLLKMADYLEKCGKAVLAGSKDTDRFMAEIDSKTPIAINYYANCVQKHDAQADKTVSSVVVEHVETSAPKIDMAPAEIFAALEALYAAASSADEKAVNNCIATLNRVNLPRKLNAVFPEMSAAATQNDFARIKVVIDSLRTNKG